MLFVGGYDGLLYFDYKFLCIEDDVGVWVSVVVCMCNYLVLCEKVWVWRLSLVCLVCMWF